MRWLKRIAITLSSLLVLVTIIVSLLLLVLDNDNYRDFSISLIENYTDIEVSINGPFSLDISLNPRLQASAIQLRDTENNFEIKIAKLNVSAALISLVFGNTKINNLEIDDIDITLNHTLFDNVSSVSLTQQSHEIEAFILPVVKNILIRNVALNIKQETSILNNYASLTQLKLALDENQNHHILEGKGQINGFDFESNGEFGNLSDLLVTDSFPINATARIANMEINLKGDIQDPLNGSGVNLTFDASTDDFLKIFREDNKFPFIGALKAHANITGNLPNVAIENINIELRNSDESFVFVTGNLPELKTGKDTNLKITSELYDPAIYSWLLPKDWPTINSLAANTFIKNNSNGDYTLNDIQLKSLVENNTKLKANGFATIKNISTQPFKKINLDIAVESPSTKILQKFISTDIPKLNKIKAKAQLNLKEQQLSLQKISVSVGTKDKLFIQATGQINHITPQSTPPITGINIKLEAKAKNTKPLEIIIKQPLPELQNIKLTAELYDNKDIYSLKNILLVSGPKQHQDIKVSGNVANIQNFNGLLLNADVNIKTTQLLRALTNKKLPDLGKTKGTFVFQRNKGFYSIDNINIDILKPDAWKLTAQGNVEHLLSDRKFSLKTTSQITDWTDLKNILNTKKLNFKTEKGSGTLSGYKNTISFSNSFDIGKTQFKFAMSVENKNNRYKVKTNLESALLYLEDFGIKPKDIDIENNNTKSNSDTKQNGISDKTIPLDKLNNLDLIASLKIDKILGNKGPLVGLDVNLSLDNGNLRIHPANLNYTDGSVKLDLGVSGHKNYESYLKLNITDVDLGSIMSQLQKTPIIKGSLNTIISLQSSGDSLQKIMKNSNGDITIVGENIKVLRKYTNLLVNDTLGWASSSLGLAQQYTTLSCSIFKFNVADKKIQSEALIVDGPDMRINGDLEINLNNETIDMKLWPKQKNTLWLNVNPVTLTGPIRDPVANTLTVGTSNVARTYGELYFAAIFIPLRALTYVSNNFVPFLGSSDGPCQELEREILEQKSK